MSQSTKLEFHIGKIGGMVPLLTMVGLMLLLTFNGVGGPKAAWAPGFIAIILGMFLVKSKRDYFQSILDGIADKTGVVVITAWIFAAVLGSLMKAGGLVDGILWFGMSTGIQGSMFLIIVFMSTAIFAMGTGSSNGANLALAPILFPAGVYLGADPAFVALALLSGAVFGDNVAPISDTTIVGCTTQGADFGATVRQRMPLSLTAGAIALVALVVFGQGDGLVEAATQNGDSARPESLLMLLSVAAVVFFALKGRHLLEALSYGILVATVVGLGIGAFAVSDLFTVPSERGVSNGIIEDAIAGVTGAVVFVILILGVIKIFMNSGIMDDILAFITERVSSSTRSTELLMFFSTSVSSLLVSSNAPSQLLVGPTLVKPLGEKNNITPERRANLMSASVCSIFYMMPWCLAVMVWYSAVETSAISSGLAVPSASISFMAPYPWALLGVMMFSIITGWKRYGNQAQAQVQPA
ncbi:Na+/H+ antiporter NhaC family protein [Shewanella pealeana]|uniref:Na+/H+ antiporter NhaC n=1 Tax=Shewanella pealeana (strain ATCC 700345 / ANG-SQ1) TaxID=398579 RepID=A8HA88_SHEPA|nr:Na+/H+ antiporter NhaC family protein [Shewanella pealeana]ABV89475.1 Na+/H+ antiporter NhaC [Shewanella pealeana ATCC 700345]